MNKMHARLKIVEGEQPEDTLSIKEIVIRYLDSMYSTALRLTKNKEWAEDVVQETCLRAFKNSEQIRSNGKSKSWMFKILMNTFINNYRKRVKEPLLVDIELSETLLELRCNLHNLNPEEIAISNILDEEIKEALDNLHVEFRTVIWLSDVEGFTYQEIQEMLGCPVGTIASRLFRARSLLREALSEYAKKRGVI